MAVCSSGIEQSKKEKELLHKKGEAELLVVKRVICVSKQERSMYLSWENTFILEDSILCRKQSHFVFVIRQIVLFFDIVLLL